MKKDRVRNLVALAVAAATLGALTAATSGAAGGRPFSTTLTGAAEVAGPGDADGTGTARLRLNSGQRTVCFTVTVRNIEAPTAAHIHEAPAGSAGPIVVPLFNTPSGSPATISGCVTSSRAQIKEIRQNPGAYYVNVHNPQFPEGAIRGQLGK